MANQDDFIKTALRLPRGLHGAIRDAAHGGGKSMNAEIIGRLQDSLRTEEVGSVLEQLKSREAELLDANRLQLEVMRGLVARADATLRAAGEALSKGAHDEANSRLLHEIAVLRDMVKATSPSKA
ncbi:Arc family DNA-binding protein [Trinickia dinghuensis]|uniref:Arc family DNA-binding protein n=1 Tax=Trinickia dinghuensis TaxID=2291023 RepID=A0A3D8K2W7_9BURK|nr:Arc family DNA-binding protein [Trinickia dinghuensis]RDU99194.1 Arc family DNA-binding protein [Trinickia dinghuensis]